MNCCDFCKRPLVVIGSNRKNGSHRYKDWNSRLYHMKCYSDYMTIQNCLRMLNK